MKLIIGLVVKDGQQFIDKWIESIATELGCWNHHDDILLEHVHVKERKMQPDDTYKRIRTGERKHWNREDLSTYVLSEDIREQHKDKLCTKLLEEELIQ